MIRCVVTLPMREAIARQVLNVAKQDGVWSVNHGGDPFGHSRDKEIARAAALRRARELLDKGQACEVRVFGETANWRG